jgi:hypothetical protein
MLRTTNSNIESQSSRTPAHRIVRFGGFEADLRNGELRKDGVKLKFSGQPFQVLAVLLERPGEVVTREELQKRLWPDTFVDVERNLNTADDDYQLEAEIWRSSRWVVTRLEVQRRWLPHASHSRICSVNHSSLHGYCV